MSYEQNPQYDSHTLDQTQWAMGRGAQHEVLRVALQRAAGAPDPQLDDMQAALGAEAQIRAAVSGLVLSD